MAASAPLIAGRTLIKHLRVYRVSKSSAGYRQFEKIELWPFQIEFQAQHLAATNVLHFILGDRPGTVWIADVLVTRKKGL